MNLKFLLILSTTVVVISAAPSSPFAKRDVDSKLVPEFGHSAGINPNGSNCDGIKNAQGEVIKVPCSCPPPREEFLAALNRNVEAGHAVHNPSVSVFFPSGDDRASKHTRMVAAIVTLQNLHGPDVGCPASSTTFSAQLKAIQDGTDTPLSSVLPSTVSLSPSPSDSTRPPQPSPTTKPPDGVDRDLVPEFGHKSGLNPTGTGDCDGITNAAGQAIKIPCICPPDREDFIKARMNQALSANVAAGHAVDNPDVLVSFPPGDDKVSKLARMNAAMVTLQNLRGPGSGCPASSTTFSAQLKEIQDS